jgi:hypothetical protein
MGSDAIKLCKDCRFCYPGSASQNPAYWEKTARCGRPKYQRKSFVSGEIRIDGPLCEKERLGFEGNCGGSAYYFEKAIGG